jgi:hypothetical protein
MAVSAKNLDIGQRFVSKRAVVHVVNFKNFVFCTAMLALQPGSHSCLSAKFPPLVASYVCFVIHSSNPALKRDRPQAAGPLALR